MVNKELLKFAFNDGKRSAREWIRRTNNKIIKFVFYVGDEDYNEEHEKEKGYVVIK